MANAAPPAVNKGKGEAAEGGGEGQAPPDSPVRLRQRPNAFAGRARRDTEWKGPSAAAQQLRKSRRGPSLGRRSLQVGQGALLARQMERMKAQHKSADGGADAEHGGERTE